MSAKRFFQIAAVAFVYMAGAKIGFLTAIQPGNITAVWPPSGVALLAMFLMGPAALTGIFLGSVLINIWSLMQVPASYGHVIVLTSIGIALGSSLQAYLGNLFIRKWIGIPNVIRSSKGVFKFVCLELAVCLSAATIGVASLCMGRWLPWDNFFYSWWTWWLGDITGIILIVPLCLAWKEPWKIQFNVARLIEAVLIIGLLGWVSWLVFGRASGIQVRYAVIPFIIWSAVRFGFKETAALIFLISGIGIWQVASGHPFVAAGEVHRFLLLFQSFMGIVTVMGLSLAAAVSEQTQVKEELLERERQLRDFLEHATVGIHWTDSDGKILWANKAELEMLGYESSDYIGHLAQEFYADRAVFEDLTARLRQKETVHNYEARMRCKNGTLRHVLINCDVYWKDDRFVHTRCFTRDVTDQKKAQDERYLAHQKIKEKVAELEKLNEIMLNREERILELKEEIRLLKMQPNPESVKRV